MVSFRLLERSLVDNRMAIAYLEVLGHVALISLLELLDETGYDRPIQMRQIRDRQENPRILFPSATQSETNDISTSAFQSCLLKRRASDCAISYQFPHVDRQL